MCLFMETRINEQKEQNPKNNKRAGENKASIGGKMLKINKRACSFIRYLRVRLTYFHPKYLLLVYLSLCACLFETSQ